LENLIIKDLDNDTLVDFMDCFEKNGNKKKIENLRWQFFNNTEKKSVVDIAKDKTTGKTAAIYALACVKFKINNDLVIGSQSLDTITDVDYRGTGLFINLANDVYEKAKASVTLVYGFPNGNSVKGFKKRLKWQVLDPLPFLIKPLRSKYFTRKIKYLKFLPDVNLSPFKSALNKDYKIKESNDFPEKVNDLWAEFSKKFKVSVHRDTAYLNWRFLQKPNENYKIAHCYNLDTYVGYIIYTVKEKHGGKIGYIMDMVYDLTDQNVPTVLLRHATNKIKEEKADCILSWCLEHSPNYPVYKKERFFDFPEKLRPIELHFGARSFKPEYEEVIANRDNWFISYADSDTV